MRKNYIDENIDSLRSEFKMLEHRDYLNAGEQMISGNYGLKAAREFFEILSRWEMCLSQGSPRTHFL
tara:strand:- start:25061 stop:25261 length:201 start_codon:yes stop_codon:yes gene_type:complete